MCGQSIGFEHLKTIHVHAAHLQGFTTRERVVFSREVVVCVFIADAPAAFFGEGVACGTARHGERDAFWAQRTTPSNHPKKRKRAGISRMEREGLNVTSRIVYEKTIK